MSTINSVVQQKQCFVQIAASQAAWNLPHFYFSWLFISTTNLWKIILPHHLIVYLSLLDTWPLKVLKNSVHWPCHRPYFFLFHFAELFPKVLYLLELYLPVKWKQHTSPNYTSSMLSFSLKCMMGEGFNTKHFSGREGLEHKGCSPASASLRMLEETRTGVGSVKA